MRNRVVITGYGIYSCIGQNINQVTDSLRFGKSGIGLDLKRKNLGYRSSLTGILPDPDIKKLLDRRARISLSQQAEYALVATNEAFELANITPDIIESSQMGVIYGNDSSASAVIKSYELLLEKKDTSLLGSGGIFQSLNSTVSMNLSTIFKLKGINFTLSAACASGSHSIGMAYILIKCGLQEMVLCGGAQELNEYTFGSFDGLGTFSMLESNPSKASRPFDATRDGLVTSGGAASIVLETLESALKRGAHIIAEVIGYGFSSNGDHISSSNVLGQIKSLEASLKMASCQPSEIDYINAHATSTPHGDGVEAQAIYQVFGGKTPVSSTKSMTGHECWMAGASEIVYSLIMMENQFIAPNINFESADEHSSKINIMPETTQKELNKILSNSFGFGGTNSSLILQKFEK